MNNNPTLVRHGKEAGPIDLSRPIDAAPFDGTRGQAVAKVLEAFAFTARVGAKLTISGWCEYARREAVNTSATNMRWLLAEGWITEDHSRGLRLTIGLLQAVAKAIKDTAEAKAKAAALADTAEEGARPSFPESEPSGVHAISRRTTLPAPAPTFVRASVPLPPPYAPRRSA